MNLNNNYRNLDYLSGLFSLYSQSQNFRGDSVAGNIRRNSVEGVPYQLIPDNQVRRDSTIERVANEIISKIISPLTNYLSPQVRSPAVGNSGLAQSSLADVYSTIEDLGQVYSFLRAVAPGDKAEPYIGLLNQAMGAFGSKDSADLNEFISAANMLGISGDTVGDIFAAANGWSGLDTESKITKGGNIGLNVLHELGVLDGAQRQDLSGMLSELKTSDLNSLLSAFDTVSNWGEMSREQRLKSVVGSADNILTSFENSGVDLGIKNLTGSLGGAVRGGFQIYEGVQQFKDVIDALGDMTGGSQGAKFGAMGGGAAGLAIGGGIGVLTGAAAGSMIFPGIGTLVGATIGAAIGFFGSSKKKDQMMRDQWREGLEHNGFAQVVDGCHTVKLADGTDYKIGMDGKTKLKNLDGTERQTFDIDWGNKLAADSVPLAHLYGLATGLNPSMVEGDLFNRAISQSLNAATSNATTMEQVRDNFKSMMAAGGVDPLELAAKCEFLRVTNKISEGEYGAYINGLNSMYDIKLAPSDRAKAHLAILSELRQSSSPTEQELELMLLLTDEAAYSKSVQDLEERVNPESKKARRRLEAMTMQLTPRYNNIETS